MILMLHTNIIISLFTIHNLGLVICSKNTDNVSYKRASIISTNQELSGKSNINILTGILNSKYNKNVPLQGETIDTNKKDKILQHNMTQSVKKKALKINVNHQTLDFYQDVYNKHNIEFFQFRKLYLNQNNVKTQIDLFLSVLDALCQLKDSFWNAKRNFDQFLKTNEKPHKTVENLILSTFQIVEHARIFIISLKNHIYLFNGYLVLIYLHRELAKETGYINLYQLIEKAMCGLRKLITEFETIKNEIKSLRERAVLLSSYSRNKLMD